MSSVSMVYLCQHLSMTWFFAKNGSLEGLSVTCCMTNDHQKKKETVAVLCSCWYLNLRLIVFLAYCADCSFCTLRRLPQGVAYVWVTLVPSIIINGTHYLLNCLLSCLLNCLLNCQGRSYQVYLQNGRNDRSKLVKKLARSCGECTNGVFDQIKTIQTDIYRCRCQEKK